MIAGAFISPPLQMLLTVLVCDGRTVLTCTKTDEAGFLSSEASYCNNSKAVGTVCSSRHVNHKAGVSRGQGGQGEGPVGRQEGLHIQNMIKGTGQTRGTGSEEGAQSGWVNECRPGGRRGEGGLSVLRICLA